MKRLITITALLILILAACSSATGDSAYPNPPYPDPAYPNSPQSGDYVPSPADSSLVRGQVFLDTTELIVMESFPLQFLLHLAGNLPTPCNQLRISVAAPDAENKINLDVYSVTNPDKVCIQTLEPFDVNFSMGSYPTGHYFLYVNGALVTEFDA